MNTEKEIAPYKKKKASNTSKAKRKSKHKHQYIEACIVEPRDKLRYEVLKCEYEKHWYRAQVCKICGRIKSVKIFETVRENGGFRILNEKETRERLKDLPRFYVTDCFDRKASVTDINSNPV